MRKPHAIRAIERNLGPRDRRPFDWAIAFAFLTAVAASAFLVGALTAAMYGG